MDLYCHFPIQNEFNNVFLFLLNFYYSSKNYFFNVIIFIKTEERRIVMAVHVPTRRRGEKRTEEISFKVSRDEKAMITAAAKSMNTKKAILIRKVLFEYGIGVEVPKEEPKATERPAPKVSRELMLEVAKMSNRLSQLANWVTKYKTEEDVVLVVFTLVALDQTLSELVHGLPTYKK